MSSCINFGFQSVRFVSVKKSMTTIKSWEYILNFKISLHMWSRGGATGSVHVWVLGYFIALFPLDPGSKPKLESHYREFTENMELHNCTFVNDSTW